jgi:hypothetical protein
MESALFCSSSRMRWIDAMTSSGNACIPNARQFPALRITQTRDSPIDPNAARLTFSCSKGKPEGRSVRISKATLLLCSVLRDPGLHHLLCSNRVLRLNVSGHGLQALQDELVSKAFSGREGRALLMHSLMNVQVGKSEDRTLLTGVHTVRHSLSLAALP